MKYYVRTYLVEGLNLGKERFLWKKQLMFTDSDNSGNNLATAHILLKRPLPHIDDDSDDYFSKSAIDDAEALQVLSIFLACYHLSINTGMPKIIQSHLGGYPLDNLDKFGLEHSVPGLEIKHRTTKTSPEMTLKGLKFSLPLFEKVMKSIHLKQKKPKTPLAIALPIYQRAAGSIDAITIVDWVTVLESLTSDGENELSYKFALRTSLLVEKNSNERHDLFKFLKKCYGLRSSMVHGTEIRLSQFSIEQSRIIYRLQNITKQALKKYVDMVDSGLNKEQIIAKLDEQALGLGQIGLK